MQGIEGSRDSGIQGSGTIHSPETLRSAIKFFEAAPYEQHGESNEWTLSYKTHIAILTDAFSELLTLRHVDATDDDPRFVPNPQSPIPNPHDVADPDALPPLEPSRDREGAGSDSPPVHVNTGRQHEIPASCPVCRKWAAIAAYHATRARRAEVMGLMATQLAAEDFLDKSQLRHHLSLIGDVLVIGVRHPDPDLGVESGFIERMLSA